MYTPSNNLRNSKTEIIESTRGQLSRYYGHISMQLIRSLNKNICSNYGYFLNQLFSSHLKINVLNRYLITCSKNESTNELMDSLIYLDFTDHLSTCASDSFMTFCTLIYIYILHLHYIFT